MEPVATPASVKANSNFDLVRLPMNHQPLASAASEEDVLQNRFLFLYAVALTDLRLDPLELEVLYEIGTRRGMPKEKVDQILLSPHAAQPSVPHEALDRVEYLYDFALMIQADGVIETEERRMLVKLCSVFGFEIDNCAEIAQFLLDKAEAKTPTEDVRVAAAASL